jgi:hypothetical protein
MTEASPSRPDDFRVVVDAQITLAMFLVRRNRPPAVPTKRFPFQLLPRLTCSRLWTLDYP